MDKVGARNCRTFLISLYDALEKNFNVFEKLVQNYDALLEMIQQQPNDVVYEKKLELFRLWFKYWIGLRDEYSFFFHGCLIHDYQLEGRTERTALYFETEKRIGFDKNIINESFQCYACSVRGSLYFIKKRVQVSLFTMLFLFVYNAISFFKGFKFKMV
jgi:hypothetical protein